MNRSELIYERLMICIHKGEVQNIELVKILQDISIILGLKSLTNYANQEGITYQGARKRKLNRITIDKIDFIIDNN
jgi:hypothetical protein